MPLGYVAAATAVYSAIDGSQQASKANKTNKDISMQQLAQKQQAMDYAKNLQYGGYNIQGLGGSGAGWNPSTGVTMNAGDLGGLRNALSQFSTNSALGAQQGMPSNVQSAYGNLSGLQGVGDLGLGDLQSLQSGSNNAFQLASQGLQSGYGQGQNLLNQAGQNYNDVYGSTLSNLRQQAQPQQEQQYNKFMGDLFGSGRMGTSGGAMQTEAFAKGLGQADLAMQNQAYQTADQTRQTDYSLGQGLINNAFQNFGNTMSQNADISNQRFQRSMYGNETAYNRGNTALQNSMSYESYLPQLQQLFANNSLSGLSGVSGVDQNIQNLFNTGQNAQNSYSNFQLGQASAMNGASAGQINSVQPNYAGSLAMGQVANAFAPQGGYASLFGGNSNTSYPRTTTANYDSSGLFTGLSGIGSV